MRKISTLLFYLLATAGWAQEIALTFDDVPTSNGPIYSGQVRTDKIIQHLKNKGVEHVAFFVITGNIDDRGSARLRKYSDAGHFIANHTHSHRRMDAMGLAQYIRDIEIADDKLRSHPGFKPWFRFPFLDEGRTESKRDSLRTLLNNLQLMNGYVTVDNYDWYINNLLKDAVSKKMKVDTASLRNLYIDHIWQSIAFYDAISKRVLGRSAKHVLLLHENDLAALFVDDLIDHIRSKGWKIISPDEAYYDPIAQQIPNVLFNGQGRIAAIAREKGVPARELVQESEDEEFLKTLVQTKKVFQ
jgi:peptidoglycan-N-acetylglucosamine deacetylase